MDSILLRGTDFGSSSGKLAVGEFEPGEDVKEFLGSCKVLVVGAGGLGCEILKDLALSGFRDIHVIDMDTIDVSNLNRQFLFRAKDVGQPKATTAANFINERCEGANVVAYVGKVQDKDADFYRQFNVVVSGLDNIEARRWINAMLINLAEVDDEGNVDPETIIPMVDGGTEGFKGQGRLIVPRFTSCFECSLDSFPPQTTYPLCTIAETPRLPEHCISYAQLVEWPKKFPNQALDKDSPTDMQWIFKVAKERADKFQIQGVTYMKTMGVVKNIIPAVASTNAVIAAACANECFKIMTLSSQQLNTYFMYMGNDSIYSHTFDYAKKDDCPVCSSTTRTVTCAPTMLLGSLVEQLQDDVKLKAPSLTTADKSLYMRKPAFLETATRANLEKPLSELVDDDEVITVTDPIFPGDASLMVKISFALPDSQRGD